MLINKVQLSVFGYCLYCQKDKTKIEQNQKESKRIRKNQKESKRIKMNQNSLFKINKNERNAFSSILTHIYIQKRKKKKNEKFYTDFTRPIFILSFSKIA